MVPVLGAPQPDGSRVRMVPFSHIRIYKCGRMWVAEMATVLFPRNTFQEAVDIANELIMAAL